ncbi:MAG: rRNA maturation RNase YbeY [Bacteroidales bacterium]|nr:rRNA maturation RNase YbeY [Bacteroidales bacterium]
MKIKINFFNENIKFVLKNKIILRNWITSVIEEEKITAESINYIFCSDKYLLEINLKFLNRDTLTDVISFNYNEINEPIQGDIYISIERIKENSLILGQPFKNEIYRIMIHGLLHLIGYEDTKPEEKLLMTKKEDYYLSKLSLIKD